MRGRGSVDRLFVNGFGRWNGKLTAYDAGTGVIPSHRRRGISREMFEMMMPPFAESGIEQFLLEVITTNTGAIALYERLGFRVVRELGLLQRDERLPTADSSSGFDIRSIDDPDWNELGSFWEAQPSWQNSIDAVKRSRDHKRILGAHADEKCIGYIVFSSIFGRISQLAVHPEYRDRDVGTALVLSMQTEMAEGFSMQVINIDKASTSAIEFFNKLGFYERLSQYEMLREM